LSFTLPEQLHSDHCELWLQIDMLQFWYESALKGRADEDEYILAFMHFCVV